MSANENYSCPDQGWSFALSAPELRFASSKIESHPCIKCQAPMVLTRVNTARLAYDVRTFECFNCDNVDKVMTETKRGSADFQLPHL
jgi:hypothetical protein